MFNRVLQATILFIARRFYRVRTVGVSSVPAEGGVLLIANHVTYVDALVISVACPRPVRFLAYESFVESGFAGWLLRRMGVIPISSSRAKEAIVSASDSLRDGEVVCIFPEGQLSRTGLLNEIKKGFELIARRGRAPVLPVVMDRMWGSIFSFKGGRFFTKLPSRIPLKVTVAFGDPVGPKEATSEWARSEFLRMGADAYATRWEFERTLPEALVLALVQESWRTAVVHRSKRGSSAMSRGAVLATAIGLAKRWRRGIEGERVGVALPPGFPSTIVHLGLVLAGKTPVDLPFWEGGRIRDLERFGITAVVTSRAILRGCEESFPWPDTVLDMGTELASLSKLGTLLRRFRNFISPAFIMAWVFRHRAANTAYLTAEGHFVETEGRSVMANARQITESSVLGRGDVLLSSLGLTRPEGQQLSLWLPLLEGVTSVSMPVVTNAAMLEEILVREEVTRAAATDEILRVMANEMIHERTPALRALLVFKESRWSDEFADSEVRVLSGRACNRLGVVVSMNSFDPEVTTSTASPQNGARAGSVGRLLPGIAGKTGPDGMVGIYAPSLGVSERQTLGWPGEFDADGFLFPGETAEKAFVGAAKP